jgi:hypothetical protein
MNSNRFRYEGVLNSKIGDSVARRRLLRSLDVSLTSFKAFDGARGASA